MSIISDGPDAQNEIFKPQFAEQVPDNLARATFRLGFPPSYVIVGVYRLCTDKSLYKPAWEKCRNGTRRGALVGLAWTLATFNIQRGFIAFFLSNSPRVTGLSKSSIFGYPIPFTVQTYAAFLLVGSQVTFILQFFLSRNIRIARERVWEQTVASRGYNDEFFQSYVEERAQPPRVVADSWEAKLDRFLASWVGRMFVKRVLLLPFSLYPLVGILTSAALKALGTGEYLHARYFKAKKMTENERNIFIEERKWDYRIFGFTAALLEGLPFIGLFFTVSNRVGAAMWAYDLEKRQHFVRAKKAGGASLQ